MAWCRLTIATSDAGKSRSGPFIARRTPAAGPQLDMLPTFKDQSPQARCAVAIDVERHHKNCLVSESSGGPAIGETPDSASRSLPRFPKL
jgi:hypothetical protein